MSSNKKKPWQLLEKLAASESNVLAKKINEITTQLNNSNNKKHSLLGLIANYSLFQPNQPISLIRNQHDFKVKLKKMVSDISSQIDNLENERQDLIAQWKLITAREDGFRKLNETDIQRRRQATHKIDQQLIDERSTQPPPKYADDNY